MVPVEERVERVRPLAIGGSDIAAILGLDEWRDGFSVWASKTGRVSKSPATPRMRLGKLFERGIIQYYEELTGRETIFCDATSRHPERPWMAYTPDAICKKEPRGVDAKLVNWDQQHKWDRENQFKIPPHVQFQAYWYMAAMDYPLWDIIAVVGSDEPRLYTFERDLELEGEMLRRAEEFWTRYLVGSEQPPIGHSDESSRYLKERFPRNRSTMREATPEEAAVLDKYAVARAVRKEAEDFSEDLENTIKRAIGDGEGLSWENGRCTWKSNKDRVTTDWETLAAKLMESLSADERNAKISEYTTTAPGARPFLFKAKL
jgi:predicted phage-related endonuclease